MTIYDLECVIIHCGEPTLKKCVASIENQTYLPFVLRWVEHVTPLNESINKMHSIITNPYCIKVDADMELYPKCFELLYLLITVLGDDYWNASVMLDDPYIGTMGAIHIYRTEYIKNLIVPNIIGCDRWIVKEMEKQGLKRHEVNMVMGKHNSNWSLDNVFKRHLRMGQKHTHYKSNRHDDWIKNIGSKWLAGDRSAFIALLGYCYGLLNENKNEKDTQFGETEWGIVRGLLTSGVIPKPEDIR